MTAGWIETGTHVSAVAAVVRIGIQIAACSVARDSPFHTGVVTAPCDALAKLIRTRRRAAKAATAAIVEIVLQVGTIRAATGFAVNTAVVAAGPAVGIRAQVAACAVANCLRTANVFAAGSAQAAGVAIAGLAGGEAWILLGIVGTAIANGFARILPGSPGGSQFPRIEDGSRQSGSQQAERLTPGNGFIE